MYADKCTTSPWSVWRVLGSIIIAFKYSLLVIGVHFTLFLQCFRLLLRDKAKQRSTYLLLAYICSAFIIGTLYVASEAVIIQYTFIDYARIEGGQFGFYLTETKLPVYLMGVFAAIFGNWLGDCLLVSIENHAFPYRPFLIRYSVIIL